MVFLCPSLSSKCMGREEKDSGYELLQSGRMYNWSISHVLVRIGIFSSLGVGLVFFLEMLCAALARLAIWDLLCFCLVEDGVVGIFR